MKKFYDYEFPIGKIRIEEMDGKICAITSELEVDVADGIREESPILQEARVQLEEYFAGGRKEFTLPLQLDGTAFQVSVWRALLQIPYGEVRSYGEIAKAVGNPKSSRAVGMANHKNPIMVVVPCHRVIGANGALVGYAGGLEKKQYLLNLEKAHKENR
ncbi:Methylated-DNA--protein-cysteine methyltransferase, constitutive [Clostridiales bacterium CHKCI001]|nr:Methylated-DNA--protein-cysteine methyltransferase, constitutive [Clostridiales bacterium CHKCI001]